MINFTFWFLFITLLVVIILSLFLFFIYRNLYIPDQKIIPISSEHKYHDIYLPIGSKDGRHYNKSNRPSCLCINVWHFNSYPKANTILYFHGNVGNNSHRDYVMNICHKFHLNLVLVDPRGFGRSNSHPTPEGICEDAETAYLYLAKQVKPETIIVWGESLGGALATNIASSYKCKSLILLATFSSIDDVPRFHEKVGPWIGKGMGKMIEYACNRLPNKEWISEVNVPLLILHSKTDDIIPYKCSQILIKAAKKSPCKKLISIKGGHSSPDITEQQLRCIFNFCDVDMASFCPRSFSETRCDIREAGKRHFARYHTQGSIRRKYG